MLSKVDQDTFYQKLGENIKAARESKKVKQETLASHLGFSRISVSNIEMGKQKIQVHSLVEVSNYLQVPLEQLVPLRDISKSGITSQMEKKISNTEVLNRKSLEKIKDFIRLSTSNSEK